MVHVTRLAHVGLQARSLSTQAEFYNDRWGLERVTLDDIDRAYEDLLAREALGFKLTDRFVGGLSFWACNANHHSLAFGQARDGLKAREEGGRASRAPGAPAAISSATICSRITRIPRATPSNTPLKSSRLPIQIASHASWSPIQTSGAARRRTED